MTLANVSLNTQSVTLVIDFDLMMKRRKNAVVNNERLLESEIKITFQAIAIGNAL